MMSRGGHKAVPPGPTPIKLITYTRDTWNNWMGEVEDVDSFSLEELIQSKSSSSSSAGQVSRSRGDVLLKDFLSTSVRKGRDYFEEKPFYRKEWKNENIEISVDKGDFPIVIRQVEDIAREVLQKEPGARVIISSQGPFNEALREDCPQPPGWTKRRGLNSSLIQQNELSYIKVRSEGVSDYTPNPIINFLEQKLLGQNNQEKRVYIITKFKVGDFILLLYSEVQLGSNPSIGLKSLISNGREVDEFKVEIKQQQLFGKLWLSGMDRGVLVTASGFSTETTPGVNAKMNSKTDTNVKARTYKVEKCLIKQLAFYKMSATDKAAFHLKLVEFIEKNSRAYERLYTHWLWCDSDNDDTK